MPITSHKLAAVLVAWLVAIAAFANTRGFDFSGQPNHAGAIGGLLARTDSGGSIYYHADGSGNITGLMDGSENMVGRYLYNPFGKILGQWGKMAEPNVMRFSSMPYYGKPSIYGFWGRFWSPELQRWLNNDPIGEAGGINLTMGMHNDPLNYVDPLGLSPDSWPFIGPAISNMELNDFARRFSDKDGNQFKDYNDAKQNLFPKNSDVPTAGDPAAVAAAADAAQAAANGYLAAATAMTPAGAEDALALGLAGKAKKCPTAANATAKAAEDAAQAGSELKGAEAARAALGKGPLANPGAALTDGMKAALKDNLAAAQKNLDLAQQGLNHSGNPFLNSEVQQNAINTAQSRINEINSILK